MILHYWTLSGTEKQIKKSLVLYSIFLWLKNTCIRFQKGTGQLALWLLKDYLLGFFMLIYCFVFLHQKVIHGTFSVQGPWFCLTYLLQKFHRCYFSFLLLVSNREFKGKSKNSPCSKDIYFILCYLYPFLYDVLVYWVTLKIFSFLECKQFMDSPPQDSIASSHVELRVLFHSQLSC